MKGLWQLCLFLHGLQALDSSPCSCSCCTFHSQNRVGEASGHCELVAKDQMFMSPSSAQVQPCAQLCNRNATDKIITNAEGEQIDYQRFCYFECHPSAALGNTCVPQTVSSQKLAALPVIQHHHHHRHIKSHKTAQIARGSHYQRLVSVKQAAAAEPWPSMKDEYSAIGLRAEQESKQAAKDMMAAKNAAVENAKIAITNAKIAPSLLASVSAAENSARQAHVSEKELTQTVKEVQEAAALAAHDVIDEAIEQARDEAHAKAKTEAQKAAKALMEKMLKEVPAAAKAASAPYIAAMNRAHDYAAKYAALGDTWAGKSVQLQMSAQLLMGEANSWQTLGETGKSQGQFQQAHQMMDLAVAFNAKAGSLYAAGVEVASHDGEWVAEADAAAYHATIMLNPDAPPPAVYGGR